MNPELEMLQIKLLLFIGAQLAILVGESDYANEKTMTSNGETLKALVDEVNRLNQFYKRAQ